MTESIEVKPFFEYDKLIQRLTERGLLIKNPLRAQRKLTQVGYYRLSGYWYTSRKFKYIDRKIQYESDFQKNTHFENIFDFYLFDKRLRIECTDALERIEIYLRTIIAHEIGRIDPLAYLDIKQFSKKAFNEDSNIRYCDWISRHDRLIKESKEDSIVDHLKKGKPIPIWVAAEAWDFGALSKFYSILSGKNQDLVCARLGLDNRLELNNWLINLNGIRNRCAHHSRLCNRTNPRTLKIPHKGYFNLLELEESSKNRFYGIIAVIWFLLKQIGPNSTWICRIADLIDQKPQIPGFTYKSMGFAESGFPRDIFPEAVKAETYEKSAIEQLEESWESFFTLKKSLCLKQVAIKDKPRLEKLIDALTDSSYNIDKDIQET